MPPPEHEFGILLILGIGVFGGMLGAWLFQRLRIPQVIGYIAIGLILGESGFGFIALPDLAALKPFSFLALAFIGFLVGGELEGHIFKQYGKQFTGIMFGEGLGAFFIVGPATGLFLWVVTGSVTAALAGGIVFGAISSATDPASTIDVLWEYRSKGPLTTGLIAVVALDDALALGLYALGTSAANLLVGDGFDLHELARTLGVELLGSIVLGLLLGYLLNYILRRSHSPERSLTLCIGSLLLLAGVCLSFELDVILCAMSAGALLINECRHLAKPLLKTLREFAAPVYVMFFVMVGARLQLSALPLWMLALAAIYVIGRTAGKYYGTILGGKIGGASPVLQQYLGMGLFAQGGVAIGLSMMAAQRLSGVEVMPGLDLGATVVTVVTTTTLAVQILGPPFVKFAITRSGEIGRNITEEDIIAELSVGDLMNRSPATLAETDLLQHVFQEIAEHDQLVFPVVNPQGGCCGVISLDSLKALFLQHDIWNWMIAEDAMAPVQDLLREDTALADALARMKQIDADETVVRDPETLRPIGIFDLRSARRSISQRLLQRQGITL